MGSNSRRSALNGRIKRREICREPDAMQTDRPQTSSIRKRRTIIIGNQNTGPSMCERKKERKKKIFQKGQRQEETKGVFESPAVPAKSCGFREGGFEASRLRRD